VRLSRASRYAATAVVDISREVCHSTATSLERSNYPIIFWEGSYAMRLLVDTSEIQFTVGRPFVPKTDQAGVQRTEKGTGRPLHVVQLVAIDGTGAETINVTVAGENPPLLAQGQSVRPVGLEAIPWVKSNTNSAQVAFRATSITPLGAAKPVSS
jgi:hypothetical protein